MIFFPATQFSIFLLEIASSLASSCENQDAAEDETDKNRLKRVRDLMKRAIEDGKNGKQQSIQVKVLKNRNGSKGETLISFWPLFNHFEDKSQSK